MHKIEIQIIDSNKSKLATLLKVLPIELRNVPDPGICHLLMCSIANASHLNKNFFDKLEHPCDKLIGLRVGVLG